MGKRRSTTIGLISPRKSTCKDIEQDVRSWLILFPVCRSVASDQNSCTKASMQYQLLTSYTGDPPNYSPLTLPRCAMLSMLMNSAMSYLEYINKGSASSVSGTSPGMQS